MERFSVLGPAGDISGLRRVTDGAGAPVVLVHGVNGAAVQWSGVAERLTDRTTIAVDLRGHGDSESGDGRYGAEDYAGDVAAVMDGLGVDRAHLVGTSFGGGVCLTLAAAQPDRIRSVAILGGALSVTGTADADAAVGALHLLGTEPFFEQVAAASFAPGSDAELIRDSVRLAARNDAITVERILRAAFSADVSAAAAGVTAPALVLTGELDQTCPPALGVALAAALRTDCRVLPGRGHMAHVEDPDLIAGLIDAQLRQVDSADTARKG
ncbi:3-oxoadipate enol-lactonase [Mycobacterium frederiksbergense]|uniref:3-oxoadipate enol-lactonase n=1 Tax=Mycolicibacterium frederiksbergense TaxID=117567 RepID=A0ABT6KW30_9MYCO|nr:alpha/beta fold hydrolase [Mycolicibacterium frederiksbergense]MDH6194823.1 3-oxoadipate enol-lactonase [Mycolicibacterium frederiksbergense]